MYSLQDQAYDHIKHLIMHDKLSYQEIYSETKFAKAIGISRTPFRDAIHRLMQEGYIDIIPSKGFQLHQLSVKDVEETFQVRSALECFCTLEIAKHYTNPENQKLFRELETITDNMKRIMDTTHSIPDFKTYDFQFHVKIISFLENAQFISIFNTFMYRMQRLAMLSLSHPNRMENTLKEHLDILNTMEKGDTTHIYETTLLHMDTPKDLNLEDLYHNSVL